MCSPLGSSNLQKCSKSVIYVAFGYEYFVMAVHSAISVAKTNKNVYVQIYTNIKSAYKLVEAASSHRFEVVFIDSPDKNNRAYKLSVDTLTSYDKTIYLDVDTEVHGDLSPVFDGLDYAEMYLLPLVANKSLHQLPPFEKSLSTFSYWNGGVVAFKKTNSVHEFFAKWRENYKTLGIHADQPSLAKTILTSQIPIKPLSIWYNAIWNHTYRNVIKKNIKNQIVVLHYMHPHNHPEIPKKLLNVHFLFRKNAKIDKRFFQNESVRSFEAKFKMLSNPLYSFRLGITSFNPFLRFYYKWNYNLSDKLYAKKTRPSLGS